MGNNFNTARVYHGMAMGMGSRRGPIAEMNITPMIDVLLVLIIIFLMLVPVPQKGFDTLVPHEPAVGQPAPPEQTIVIQVRTYGESKSPQIKINQDEVAWGRLKDTLESIYKWRAEKVAFVTADKDIDFQYVASVIDIAHEVGINHIGLIPGHIKE